MQVKPTLDKNVIYSIQVLRGVAALLVIIRHIGRRISTTPGYSFEVGQCGVDIFFVISGFVIYLTGRKAGWKDFARRRLSRIVPLYWTVLAITISVGIIRGTRTFPFSNVILSFLFIPAHSTPREVFPPLSVGWSLNFEAYFYLIFTLSLFLWPRLSPLIPVSFIIAAGCLAGPAALNLADANVYPIALLLLPISFEFVAGMWLAERWVAGARGRPWCAVAVIPIAVVWFALAPTASAYTLARPLYWGIPAIALVWGLLNLESVIAFKRWRLALVIGDASYALYLSHQLILPGIEVVLKWIVPGLPTALVVLAMMAGSILAGVALHFFLELPLLRLTNLLFGEKPVKRNIGVGSTHMKIGPIEVPEYSNDRKSRSADPPT